MLNDCVRLGSQETGPPSVREEGFVRPDAGKSFRHSQDVVWCQDHLGWRQLLGGHRLARFQEQDVRTMW